MLIILLVLWGHDIKPRKILKTPHDKDIRNLIERREIRENTQLMEIDIVP